MRIINFRFTDESQSHGKVIRIYSCNLFTSESVHFATLSKTTLRILLKASGFRSVEKTVPNMRSGLV